MTYLLYSGGGIFVFPTVNWYKRWQTFTNENVKTIGRTSFLPPSIMFSVLFCQRSRGPLEVLGRTSRLILGFYLYMSRLSLIYTHKWLTVESIPS